MRVMAAALVTQLPPAPMLTVPVIAKLAEAPLASVPTSQIPVAGLYAPAVAPEPEKTNAVGKTSVTWIKAVLGMPALVTARVKTISSPTFTWVGATVLLSRRFPGVRNKPASMAKLVWPEPNMVGSVMPESESGSLSRLGSVRAYWGLN